MASVEQYKEDIADKYIKDFKDDLNFFEKIMVASISKKMKEILKSGKKIEVNNLKDLEDLWFWRKVLWVKIWDKQLFEKLINKTFNFLKEKQEKIIQAQTEWRLEELANLVINWKLDNLEQNVNGNGWTTTDWNNETWNNETWNNTNNHEWTHTEWDNSWWDNNEESGWPNPITAWVEAWVITAATYRAWISKAERMMWLKSKETPESFNAQETKKMLNKLSAEMNEKLKSWVKMNRAQESVYKKSIKLFDEAANSLDGETAEAFKAWQKLQNKINPNLLKSFGGDIKTLKLIESLPDEELATIIGKSEKEIIEFFKSKNITISNDIAKELKILNSVDEIKWFTRILKNWTKLSRFLRWVKWMWAVTFLFAWFDVWCYFESKKEAELAAKVNELRWEIMKDNANIQLIIWLWSIWAEILALAGVCAAWGSVTWPWWTVIWAAVWLLAWAISIWYDEFYGKKKEFYAQNRYDFINQKRTKIKQSIVQLFESDRLDMHAWMKESIKDDRGPNSEIDTMEDAWEALIYQEEIMNWGYYLLQWYYSSWEKEETYKNNLNEEDKKQYEEQKKKMENIIKIRMEYIKIYVKEDKSSKEYNEMKMALLNNQWVEYVEQLLADSNVYAYLKSDDENAYIQNYKELNVETYKEAYKQKLSQEYSQEFTMFEKLGQENPAHLQEICEWVLASKWSIESSFENDDWTSCYTEQEVTILKRNIDFVVKYNEYRNLGRPIEKQVTTWISWDSVDYKYIQQVLLDLNSIDKRPVWEKESSMKYLSSYEFNDQIDSIDCQVSSSVFQNILYSIAREIHWYTWNNDKFELVWFYTWDWDTTWIYMDDAWKINDVTWFLFFGAKDESVKDPDKLTKEQALKMIIWEVDLDSDVEAADDKVTHEFRKRVKAIIDREYSYIEKKKDYEKQIIDFVTSNNQWQNGYVEIPENIVLNAKRAWIWDVHKFLFRVENWQIYALSRGDMVNTVLHFDDPNINIKYETLNPLRTELSAQEKNLISYVDSAEKKLNTLRSKQWQFLFWKEHEDDLDIPEELERIMSQKSIEWNNIKESVLYMQPSVAYDCLFQKSKEYYDYFNGMYLWLLNTVTNMSCMRWINSNDINDSAHFLSAIQFVWVDIVSIKDWKLEISNSVNENIKKYLPDLFDFYKDSTNWKTVKQLLMSKDEKENKLWQELAKKIYELCLEETVLDFDSKWNVDGISTLDFSDNDLEKVKKKLEKWLEWVWFIQACIEYRDSEKPSIESDYIIRDVKSAEVDSHKKIDEMTKKIVDTMKNVDWTHKRKTPKFQADKEQKKEWKITWRLSSRWYSEKITVNMGESGNIKSVTVDWLWEFKDPQEWFRIANFINWIKNNLDEHPYWESVNTWSLKYYEWDSNVLQRHHSWFWWDYDILEEKTLNKYYPSIKNSPKFLNYINSFVK